MTMPLGDRLAIYFDDPPIDSKSDSRGMGPVNARILDLLSPKVAFVNSMRLRAGQRLHRRPGSDIVTLYDGLPGHAIRASGRLRLPVTTVIEALFLRFRAPIAPPHYLFAPLGSDLGSLRRAARLAGRLGARFLPYLVDDPVETLRGAGHGARTIAKAEALVAACLANAPAVFAITAELAARLRPHATAKVIPLPLPYPIDAAPNAPGTEGPARPRILYVGSVNEIYREELRYWVAELDRRGFFEWGELVATSPVPEMPQIRVDRFDDRADLERAIATSAACLLPISSRESDLCLSSFPSKTLDYLAHGRLVLCSAPRESVAYGFFADNDLPLLFEEGAVSFGEVFDSLREGVNLSSRYRALLRAQFSSERFSREVHDALSSRSDLHL